MKKLVIVPAVLAVALGSWAFYPKAAAAPEYMELSLYQGAGKPVLVLISPAGQVTEQKLSNKDGSDYGYQAQVLVKLNELRSQGWQVVQMQQTETSTPDPKFPRLPDVARSATYLLEKR